MPRIKDIQGQKFGKTKAIRLSHVRTGMAFWVCLCDCGTEHITKGKHLRSGRTQSCGCLKSLKGQSSPCYKGHEKISASKWCHYKLAAVKRNLEFTVSIEEAWNKAVEQEFRCALSGESLTFTATRSDTTATASLDRIDSSRGYTVDNIQWVHKRVNLIKQNLPEKELLDWCNKISEHGKR